MTTTLTAVPNRLDWTKFALNVPPPNPLLDGGIAKFSPPPPAVTAIGSKLTVPPIVGGSVPLGTAMLHFNNQLKEFANADVYEDDQEGIIMHKILADAANLHAQLVLASIGQYGQDAAVISACLGVEGAFDRNATNKNDGLDKVTGKPRSNYGKDDPNDYDMGGAQLKQGLLQASKHLSPADALAFSLDPNQYVPYFCNEYAQLEDWAQGIINKSLSKEPRYNDARMLATLAYNFGRNGSLPYYYNGVWTAHCQSVYTNQQFFKDATSIPDTWANLGK